MVPFDYELSSLSFRDKMLSVDKGLTSLLEFASSSLLKFGVCTYLYLKQKCSVN